MEFAHEANHYELLDVSPDASPQEIRAAYMRAKATFQKDSVALYSLVDPAEAQEMIVKIENAYQVLSHPDLKRAYDRDYLNSNAPADPLSSVSMTFGSAHDKVVSIDRVPPMESSLGDELLVPPSTDYQSGAFASEEPVLPAPTPAPSTPSIELVDEWSGDQIRRARESRAFAMERLVEITRIRRSYLNAIEQEDFEKLPAPVFVRGFLQQIARELKIQADRLVPSYLGRLEKWTQSRKSR